MLDSTLNSNTIDKRFSNLTSLLKYKSEIQGNTTGVTAQYTKEDRVIDTSKARTTSAFDAASYILFSLKSCSTMKLHKLLYYCQAWSLVWDEVPLFSEKIEAWANGPVIRELFNYHRGLFSLSFMDFSIGNYTKLTEEQRDTIDSVLKFYGDKSPQWLIDQTHSETPWIKAREGLAPTERGCKEISLVDMQQYYSSL